MKILISSIFIFIYSVATAQTGDGGGLQIMHITRLDYSWQRQIAISPEDTALKLNFFVLGNDVDFKLAKQYVPPKSDNYRFSRYSKTGKAASVYIPPIIYETREKIPNQRLEIVYNRDTMIIDFIGVPVAFSASGQTDVMDTLQFYPSRYLKCYRNFKNKLSWLFGDAAKMTPLNTQRLQDSIVKIMRYGITNHNWPLLSKYELLEDLGQIKKYSVFKERGVEVIQATHFPVYELSLENISISDPETNLNSEQVEVFTKEYPVLDNEQMTYKFLLNHRFLPDQGGESNSKRSAKDNYVMMLISKLVTQRLFINGKAFTGVFKLVVNSYRYDAGPYHPSNSLNLYIYNYKNGTLTNKTFIEDIDLYEETSINRPN